MEFGVDDGGDGRAGFQGGVDGVDALALGEVRGGEVVGVVVVVGGGMRCEERKVARPSKRARVFTMGRII